MEELTGERFRPVPTRERRWAVVDSGRKAEGCGPVDSVERVEATNRVQPAISRIARERRNRRRGPTILDFASRGSPPSIAARESPSRPDRWFPRGRGERQRFPARMPATRDGRAESPSEVVAPRPDEWRRVEASLRRVVATEFHGWFSYGKACKEVSKCLSGVMESGFHSAHWNPGDLGNIRE